MVRFALVRAGFDVLEAGGGEAALECFERCRPSLVVLDIVMPDLDGTEVCRRLRGRSDVPIVFLSSRDEEIDRIVGLELGGDDYVSKPFSPRELVARVRAVLRRAGRSAPRPVAQLVRHGPLEVDTARFEVRWDGAPITLTVTEFALLVGLLASPGRVYSRAQLMGAAYGPDVVVSDRTIDSHVRRLRRKFEQVGGHPVSTVYGLGYKLADPPVEP